MSIRWLHLLTLSHSLTHFNSNCVSLSISVMLKIFSHLSSRSFHNRLDMHHSLFHSWTLFPFIFHTLAIQQQTPSLTLSIYISQSIILSLSTYFIHSTALCFFLSLSLSLFLSLFLSHSRSLLLPTSHECKHSIELSLLSDISYLLAQAALMQSQQTNTWYTGITK